MSNVDKTRVYQVNFKRSYLSLFHKPELIAGYGFGILVLGLYFILETSFTNALIVGVLFAGVSYYLLTPDEYGGEIKILALLRMIKRTRRSPKFTNEIQFEIWDNCIFKDHTVSVVLEVRGVNLRTLGTEERATYYKLLGDALNILSTLNFQIIVRKERAQMTDFIDHVRFIEHALAEHSGHKEEHAKVYVENIGKMLDEYWVHNTKVYLIVTQSVKKPFGLEAKTKAIQVLASTTQPFLDDLKSANIETRQLFTKELTEFSRSFVK